MTLITYGPTGASPKGQVNQGGGIAFDVGAALATGGGQFSVDSSAFPLLVQALDKYPGLQRITPGAPVYTDAITPVQAHTGTVAPATGDMLARSSDGYFATVPVGGTDQHMVVRPDGTIGYVTPTAISARAWGVLPTATSSANVAAMQGAINQATQNAAKGPGGTAAAGTIDIAPGTYTFNANLLWKYGVRTRTPGRYSVTFQADATAPLSNFQNGSRTDSTGAKVPALIRWDGGDQWAHGVHIVGVEFVVNTVPGLSATWFQATGETSLFDDCGCSNTQPVNRTVRNAQLVAGSNLVALTQVPTLLASTTVGGSVPLTSSAINTAGATLLVVTIGASGSTPTVTDNLGNAWTVVGSSPAWIAYAWQRTGGGSLITGAGHTVTVGATSLPDIYFSAYSGTLTSADPIGTKHTNAATGANALTAPSIIPTEPYELFVTVLNGNGGMAPATIDSGFSIVNSVDLVGGVHYGNFTATKVSTDSTALSPTWTTATNPGTATTMIAVSPGVVADSFTHDDVNAVITMAGGLDASGNPVTAAPAVPVATASGTGSALAAGTYQVAVRYQTANGESVLSAIQNVTITAGQNIAVTSPTTATGVTGYVVYIAQGGALIRQTGVIAIGTNYTQSAAISLTGANPYQKIDRINWLVNSTAATATSAILRNPAVQTLSNVTFTVSRPTDAFIFDGGGVAGRIGTLNGVKNSGALLRLKNSAGAFHIDELSGDDNIGGMLRGSLINTGGDPGSIHVGMIKSESDTYNANWQWAMDPVVLFDRCSQISVKIDGASVIGNSYCRDVVRSDNPIGNWDYYGPSNLTPFVGGPSFELNGLEGQNWYNPAYQNIFHDTLTGESIPVSGGRESGSPNYNADPAYATIFWNKHVRLGGGADAPDLMPSSQFLPLFHGAPLAYNNATWNWTTGPELLGALGYNSSNAQNDGFGWYIPLLKGTHRVFFWGGTGTASAILTFDFSMDGGTTWTTIGTLDEYNAGAVASITANWGNVIVPRSGKAIFRIRALTRNASNTTGWTIGFSAVSFTRITSP